MSEELVKVAVRVRPFNAREKENNAKLCVAMTGSQTICTNPKTNEEKKFAYDFSYWSHDGFKSDSSGYSVPDGPKYADQKRVFNDLGAGVLKNAWEGYNASLFAYGQTGSGKSYSVVGYGANKGIVPMICEEIFTTAKAVTGKTIEVTFSMLEIYSEKVRDLLDSNADRKSGLLIREDPKIGFYPQGLKKTLVDSFASISKLMDEGTALRTIASTNMNATSSRAHTIVTINLVQKYKNDGGKEMAKSSMMNLVDLAGSERANATGATGERLKEGAAINLSLTSLGNVISALADNSAGKSVRVPYRDSVLTKLLMNALGGNSKTIMIAAISPADINYDETISTLRYADRAKQIRCKAIVNEDPTEKLIADLREENSRLKKLLAEGKIDPATLAALQGANDKKTEEEKSSAEEEAMKRQLEENEKQMKLMAQTYEEKLAAAKLNEDSERSVILEKAKTIPHLTNINMDPSLSGSIKLLLEGEGKKTIGLKGKADIGLMGIGIQENHAAITNKGGMFNIERIGESKVLRNGQAVSKYVELNHLDRLVFGASQYYLFINPAKASKTDPQITFEDAQNEIGKATGIISSSKNMSQAELQCQSEILDLLPSIEEANMISITMDKKVKFSAIAVSAESRGEYDGVVKPMVMVKNFQLGLEWIWTKNKFLDRKHEITEYYLDFKDDGQINKDKYKKYDPFFESPDVFTQLGTAVVFPKSFAYNISSRGDSKIIDFKSKETGLLNVEILPCTSTGKPIPEKDFIKNPTVDLLNKNVNFTIKINTAKIHLSENFDDIFCQFQVFNDPTLYRTQTIKAASGANFNFTKQFTFNATREFLDFLINNVLYIQVWMDQKNVKPNPATANISTKEFFEKEKQQQQQSNLISGRALNDNIDPEKQKLKDDLNVAMIRGQKNEIIIKNIQKIVQLAGNNYPVSGRVLGAILQSNSEGEANKIVNEYANNRQNGLIVENHEADRPRTNSADPNKSQACTIL